MVINIITVTTATTKFKIMKTLELTPYGKTIAKFQSLKTQLTENKVTENNAFAEQLPKYSFTVKANPKANWLIKETPENLTRTEIVIRSLLMFMVPFLVDFSFLQFSTQLMFMVIPLMVYLGATVFTMKDPIKAMLTS